MTAFFYDIIYMLPLGTSLILSALGMGIGGNFLVSAADGTVMSPLAGSIVCSVIIIIALVLRHSGRKERFLIGGVILAAFISLFLILGADKRQLLYARYSWISAVIIISLAAIMVGKAAEKFMWVKIIIGTILLAANIHMMLGKKLCSKGTTAITLAVILVYVLEIMQRYWKKSGYTDVKSHVVHIAPILMALCIAASVIPTPQEAFSWQFAKDAWRAAVDECRRIAGMLTADDEEYGYAGFSESAGIKSSISGSGREVMLVSGCKDSSDRLYLGGMIFERFNGSGWETELDKKSGDREFDYIEMKTAIDKYNSHDAGEFIKDDSFVLENRLFNTKHIFAPGKTNIQSRLTKLPKYSETNPELLASSKLHYGDSYEIGYLKVNYANPELAHIADTAEPITEDEWISVLRDNSLSVNKDNSYENYLKYVEGIYENYCNESTLEMVNADLMQNKRGRVLSMEESLKRSELSDEVKEMILEVIGGVNCSTTGESNANSDSETGVHDYEKFKALSEYFQGMNYTKSAEVLPAEIDDEISYLNYFLTESQSGYCVHYATAFTLLARELGYPARYVQGYYVKRNDSKDVLVTEDSAHAWAEVYFDNFGWVIFEATPGYEVYQGWSLSGKADPKKEIRLDPYSVNTPDKDVSMDTMEQEEEKKAVQYRYFIIPIACAVLFGMIYLFIVKVVAENKYRKKNSQDKFRIMINKNLRILRIMGYPLKENDTLEEFRFRVTEDEGLKDTVQFLGLYERLLYSDYEISEVDVADIEREYSELKIRLKNKGIRYRFYIV